MKKFLVSLLFVLSFGTFASCPDKYPNNTPIKVQGLTEICNTFYVSLYDNAHWRSVASIEHLKYGSPVGQVGRIGSFKTDTRVPNAPTPAMYTNSGYDRGHLAPDGDASTADESRDTFWMTNMTPQVGSLNQQSWKYLEQNVRKTFYASNADMYVVTIATYAQVPPLVYNKIPVPSGYWKVVIVGGKERYFFAENKENAVVKEYFKVKWKPLIK